MRLLPALFDLDPWQAFLFITWMGKVIVCRNVEDWINTHTQEKDT